MRWTGRSRILIALVVGMVCVEPARRGTLPGARRRAPRGTVSISANHARMTRAPAAAAARNVHLPEPTGAGSTRGGAPRGRRHGECRRQGQQERMCWLEPGHVMNMAADTRGRHASSVSGPGPRQRPQRTGEQGAAMPCRARRRRRASRSGCAATARRIEWGDGSRGALRRRCSRAALVERGALERSSRTRFRARGSRRTGRRAAGPGPGARRGGGSATGAARTSAAAPWHRVPGPARPPRASDRACRARRRGSRGRGRDRRAG